MCKLQLFARLLSGQKKKRVHHANLTLPTHCLNWYLSHVKIKFFELNSCEVNLNELIAKNHLMMRRCILLRCGIQINTAIEIFCGQIAIWICLQIKIYILYTNKTCFFLFIFVHNVYSKSFASCIVHFKVVFYIHRFRLLPPHKHTHFSVFANGKALSSVLKRTVNIHSHNYLKMLSIVLYARWTKLRKPIPISMALNLLIHFGFLAYIFGAEPTLSSTLFHTIFVFNVH